MFRYSSRSLNSNGLCFSTSNALFGPVLSGQRYRVSTFRFFCNKYEHVVGGGRTFGVRAPSQVKREKRSSRAGINIEWRKSSNQQGAFLVGKESL
ncbi:exported hypothetical protein [Vibrio crassostreae]|nr:exported hypothetical protein [Vibrio crassostreae]